MNRTLYSNKTHRIISVCFVAIFFCLIGKAQNNIIDSFDDSSKYYTTANKPANAKNFYEKAIKAFDLKVKNNTITSQEEKKLGIAYQKAGDLLKRETKHTDALSYYIKANKLFEKINDSLGIGITYQNIATIYKHQKMIPNAIKNFNLALNYFDPNKHQTSIASVYNNIGLIHDFEFNKFDSALFFYNKSLDLYEKISDKKGISMEHSNISGVYAQLKNYDEALRHREICLKIDEEIGDKEGQLYSMWGLGEIYQYKKNYIEAEIHFKNALKIGKDLGLLYEQSEGHRVIAELYEAMGDYKKAYNHTSEFLKLNEQIMSEESVKKTAELQAQFDTEKKEQRIKLLEKDKQIDEEKHNRTKQFLLYTGIIAILVLGLLIYAVKTNRDRKRINTILEKQKQEIEIKNTELEQLSIVASETTNAVTIADAEGTILWVNRGFERLYNCTLVEFKNKHGNSIYSASSNSLLKDLVNNAINEKKSISYTYLLSNEKGSGSWIQTTLTPILKNEYVSKLVLIDADITELKQAEQEIAKQRDLLVKKNTHILQSIDYAKRIQDAILPRVTDLNSSFTDSFVLYQPKDIVSGDLYWLKEHGDEILFSVIDCTGHGVPGAFMSIFAYNLLDTIVSQYNESKPDKMLTILNQLLIKSLDKNNNHVDDGMELVICNYNKKSKLLTFSSCFSPLYFVRNGELSEYKGDLNVIGKNLQFENEITVTQIQMQSDDCVYLLTDGYADQKGGEAGKKFFYKPLREMLAKNHEKPMKEQELLLSSTINRWKGEREQIDDICIFGVRF